MMLGLALLTACSGSMPTVTPAHTSTAIVTSIANGRKNMLAERMYGLRVPSGRVYFVTQSLKKPLKEGDSVEIEVGNGSAVRIRER